MNIPQTNRQPGKLSTEETAKLLAKRHPQDATDYFATDPNPDIRHLGRLALRRNDINDLFALGDVLDGEQDHLHPVFFPKNHPAV